LNRGFGPRFPIFDQASYVNTIYLYQPIVDSRPTMV
jgi:hypothetical protein